MMIICFIGQKCHTDAQRRVHKILPLCEFWFSGYLTFVWCHVLHTGYFVSLTSVHYCYIIKELNDIQNNLLALHIKILQPRKLGGALFVLVSIYQMVQEVGPVLLLFFFRIWTSAKPRPIPNYIWQSLGPQLVCINVYAKFHHNNPINSRDKAIFTFFRIWNSASGLDRW